MDFYLVVASALVGLLVGATGVGAGALMTPMLVMFFGVAPSVAITSDLLAALCMRPFAIAIHWRRGGVDRDVVSRLSIGSVPGALLGAYTMHLLGSRTSDERELRYVLGAALVIGAGAMILRSLFRPARLVCASRGRGAITIVVGLIGGFVVGLTSIGAGSLIMIALLVLYPELRADRLVGTDLAQSLPLSVAASVGALAFSHVDLSLTAWLVVGAVPAVVVGSLLSSRVSSARLRLVITALVLVAGLRYLGAPTDVLVLTTVLIGGALLLVESRAHAKGSVPEAVEHIVALLPAGLDRDA